MTVSKLSICGPYRWSSRSPLLPTTAQLLEENGMSVSKQKPLKDVYENRVDKSDQDWVLGSVASWMLITVPMRSVFTVHRLAAKPPL